MSRSRRRGFALVDALLAVAILALGATSLIVLLRQTLHTVVETHERERRMSDASQVMASLFARDETWLDAHEGTTRHGGWNVRLERSAPGVRQIQITDTTDHHVWLESAFYRPEPIESGATNR